MFCTTNLHNFCHKIGIWDVIWRAHKHNKKGNHIIHNRILQNLKSMPGNKTVQHDSSSKKLSEKGMSYCYWILLQNVSVLTFAFSWTRNAEPLNYFCQTMHNRPPLILAPNPLPFKNAMDFTRKSQLIGISWRGNNQLQLLHCVESAKITINFNWYPLTK